MVFFKFIHICFVDYFKVFSLCAWNCGIHRTFALRCLAHPCCNL